MRDIKRPLSGLQMNILDGESTKHVRREQIFAGADVAAITEGAPHHGVGRQTLKFGR